MVFETSLQEQGSGGEGKRRPPCSFSTAAALFSPHPYFFGGIFRPRRRWPSVTLRRMTDASAGWEKRLSELWAELDGHDGAAFVGLMDALVAELPPGSATGLFERGSAFDSTGHPDRAIPLYAAALDAGLPGDRRRRAVIQMASSLRSLGKPHEAFALLTEEAARDSDSLDGAVAAFLSLALVDLGREREAVSVALTALSKYLPRYNRSLARYAGKLADKAP
jgi:hypothetical protein